MMQSLLLKLGMLAMTIGVVFWIGWQAPQAVVKDLAPVDGADGSALPAEVPTEAEETPVDRSDQSVMSAKASVEATVTRSDVSQRGLLDLNLAGPEDLESLPGIGAVLAQRVIAYRKSVGRFHAVEELREVKGIGSKKFDRLKPFVTVAASGTKGKAEKRPS
ncbi:MAG TPA: helix-hairpin-helix domain-containing protein [Nitrospiraceae bacterium]|nr:helix-hairpin-helix domain-containing protein [Nitrospiraceae bacterium]